jgi:hypothetical protein
MTDLLRRAFERAAQLPTEDQDALAAFVLAELEGGPGWALLFGPGDGAGGGGGEPCAEDEALDPPWTPRRTRGSRAQGPGGRT